MMTAKPPEPSVVLLACREMGSEIVDPVYVDVELAYCGGEGLMGELRLRLDMLPGRFALGVKASRGLSVGGRGAGPGFKNWSAL